MRIKKEKKVTFFIWILFSVWTICLFGSLVAISASKTGKLSQIHQFTWWFFLTTIALYWPVTLVHIIVFGIEITTCFYPNAHPSIKMFRKYLKLHLLFLLGVVFVLLLSYSFNVYRLFWDFYSMLFMCQYFFSSW